MTGEEKRDIVEMQLEEGTIIFDGLDDAIIGTSEQFGQNSQIVYDKEKCIDIFIEQGMDREEALEWFYFNVLGAGFSEGAPVFVTSVEDA